MSDDVNVDNSVQRAVAAVQSVLVKVGSLVTVASGAVAAAEHYLPVAQSVTLTVLGAAVFAAERYWRNVKRSV